MRDAMVDLLLVRIGFRVALADAFGDNASVAFGMASVLAILALHPCRVLEELAAKSTAHNVVKLLLHKLVTVHLVDLLLPLADGALSPKTKVNGPAILVLLDEAQGQLHSATRL